MTAHARGETSAGRGRTAPSARVRPPGPADSFRGRAAPSGGMARQAQEPSPPPGGRGPRAAGIGGAGLRLRLRLVCRRALSTKEERRSRSGADGRGLQGAEDAEVLQREPRRGGGLRRDLLPEHRDDREHVDLPRVGQAQSADLGDTFFYAFARVCFPAPVSASLSPLCLPRLPATHGPSAWASHSHNLSPSHILSASRPPSCPQNTRDDIFLSPTGTGVPDVSSGPAWLGIEPGRGRKRAPRNLPPPPLGARAADHAPGFAPPTPRPHPPGPVGWARHRIQREAGRHAEAGLKSDEEVLECEEPPGREERAVPCTGMEQSRAGRLHSRQITTLASKDI